MTTARNWIGWVAGVVLLVSTPGGAVAQDKSGYWLFRPTPDRQMRELTTDRPDITEVPFTVDAGHIQFESNLLAYARSRPDADGSVSDTFEFALTNVRIGLTNDTELSLIWQPYGLVRTRQVNPAGTLREQGMGGLDVRAKFNLWGNDTFDKVGSAFALLPHVFVPTDRFNGISADYVEGGVMAFYAVKLSEPFGLGINAGVRWAKSEPDAGYHPEFLASASLSYAWNEKLGTYYEVAVELNRDDPRGDIVVLGSGVTYKLNKNVQLDAGVNFGVTDAADRINPFVGLSTRF